MRWSVVPVVLALTSACGQVLTVEAAPSWPATGTPGYPGSSTIETLPSAQLDCFYDQSIVTASDDVLPSATLEHVLEVSNEGSLVHVRLTLDPRFVDNTYGTNSIGWPTTGRERGHTFDHLVKSDHAELSLTSRDGSRLVHLKLDYLSKDASRPSGYGTLGVSGAEGRMLEGDASDVVRASSSLDRNLNERGYSGFLVDSPATDARYQSAVGAPEWDFRVVYEVWLRASAFGDSGVGLASVPFVHASPSKASGHTVVVVRGPCPPAWENL